MNPLDLLSTIGNVGSTILTNKTNKEIANQNVNMQKEELEYNKQLNNTIMEREDNEVQRHINDLKAAGLSPLYDMQGATSGGQMQTTAPTNNYQAQSVNFDSLNQIGLHYEELKDKQVQTNIEQSKAETERAEAEAKIRNDNERLRAELDRNKIDIDKTIEEKNKLIEEKENLIRERELSKTQEEKLKEEIKELKSKIKIDSKEREKIEAEIKNIQAESLKTTTEAKQQEKWGDLERKTNYEVQMQELARQDIELQLQKIAYEEQSGKRGSYEKQRIEILRKQLAQKYVELGLDFFNKTWSNALKKQELKETKKMNHWKRLNTFPNIW